MDAKKMRIVVYRYKAGGEYHVTFDENNHDRVVVQEHLIIIEEAEFWHLVYENENDTDGLAWALINLQTQRTKAAEFNAVIDKILKENPQ